MLEKGITLICISRNNYKQIKDTFLSINNSILENKKLIKILHIDKSTIPKSSYEIGKNLLNDYSNDFIVPSNPVLEKLFASIKEINGWQKYVFKSYFSNSHINEESINNHIKNLGYAGKQNAHGWRNVAATYGQEVGGFDRDIIDRCLGHSPQKKGSMGHYDNTQFIEKRREFLNWWSNELVAKGLKI